jgi:hypothetical protein
MDEMLLPTLSTYLIQCPLFLIWLAGIVLAVIRWRKHPRVSLLAVIALVIIFIETIINTSLGMWLPLMLTEQGMNSNQVGTILSVWRCISSLVGLVIWGLLLAAIFGWRDEVLVPPVPENLTPSASTE